MKIVNFAVIAALMLPVCAGAQATRTLSIGNGFAIDTKMPLEFDAVEFNKNFIATMDAMRAQSAASYAQQAASSPLVQKRQPAMPQVDEENFTRCIVCREKIAKRDGYQITPSRDWYVKKHSSCACNFYKGWKKGEDLSFVKEAQKRQACEASMDKKYVVHTCAICGQPINGACGSVSTWSDSMGKHYAHADCFAKHRHDEASKQLMKNLDITASFCGDIERQQTVQQAAQEQLVKDLQTSLEKAQNVQLEPIQTPAKPVQTRPLKEVERDLNKFISRYGDELKAISAAKKNGEELTSEQQAVLNGFETLRAERAQIAQQSFQPVKEQPKKERSLKAINRDINNFTRRYGNDLKKISAARAKGEKLTDKQQALVDRFEALRVERANASK